MRPVLLVVCASATIAQASSGGAEITRAPTSTVAARQDLIAQAVTEASLRSGLPASWIWAVMRAESDGDPHAVSVKGALGLMQVMPSTYAALRLQLRLGVDPFDIHDNVIAGAAYLRLMFDRYGLIGMVGAYNAGPGRWEAYLAGAQALPDDTAAYIFKLASTLGFEAPSTSQDAFRAAPKAPSEASIFAPLRSGAAADELRERRQRVIEAIAANPTLVASSLGSVGSASPAGEEALVGVGAARLPQLPQPSIAQDGRLFAPVSNVSSSR